MHYGYYKEENYAVTHFYDDDDDENIIDSLSDLSLSPSSAGSSCA